MVASFTSYPLHYGFTGLMIFFNLSLLVKSDTLPVKSLTDLKKFILQGIGAIVIWWGGYETVCSPWLKNHLFQQTAA